MIKRTEGVSTTDIVGRMLMCTTRPSAQAVRLVTPPPLHFCKLRYVWTGFASSGAGPQRCRMTCAQGTSLPALYLPAGCILL